MNLKQIKLNTVLSIFAFLFLYNSYSFAQSASDILPVVQTSIHGTARGVGLGGAMNALGADFTAIGTNPAGLGLYRKSEIVISPQLFFANTEADYLSQNNAEKKNNFGLSNLGLVLNVGDEEGDWQNTSIAIGYNKLNNFNRQLLVGGVNSYNSLTDYLAEQGNGTPAGDLSTQSPYDAFLGWETYLINPNDTTNLPNQYTGAAANGGITQQILQTTKGSLNEINIALGTNYKNKLYLGATLGIPTLNYESELLMSETDTKNLHPNFNSLAFYDNVTTKGAGINAKLGLIYRPTDMFRIGFSVHTPTAYTLTDKYSRTLESDVAEGKFTKNSPNGEYKYKLITPWKINLGGAFIYKNKGLISVEYEFNDVTSTEYDYNNGDGLQSSRINQEIRTMYQPIHTIKAGAELVIDIFRIRGGYGISTNPYKNADGGLNNQISGGLGFREKNFYLDLGIAHTFNNTYYKPYTLKAETVETANITRKATNFVLSAGFNF